VFNLEWVKAEQAKLLPPFYNTKFNNWKDGKSSEHLLNPAEFKTMRVFSKEQRLRDKDYDFLHDCQESYLLNQKKKTRLLFYMSIIGAFIGTLFTFLSWQNFKKQDLILTTERNIKIANNFMSSDDQLDALLNSIKTLKNLEYTKLKDKSVVHSIYNTNKILQDLSTVVQANQENSFIRSTSLNIEQQILATAQDTDILIYGLSKALNLEVKNKISVKSSILETELSPDGTVIISVSEADRDRLKIWNIESGEHLRDIDFPGFNIEGVKFSPDGNLIAVSLSGQNKTKEVKLIEKRNHKTVDTIEVSSSEVKSLKFSPDSQFLGIVSDNIYIWERKEKKVVASFLLTDFKEELDRTKNVNQYDSPFLQEVQFTDIIFGKLKEKVILASTHGIYEVSVNQPLVFNSLNPPISVYSNHLDFDSTEDKLIFSSFDKVGLINFDIEKVRFFSGGSKLIQSSEFVDENHFLSISSDGDIKVKEIQPVQEFRDQVNLRFTVSDLTFLGKTQDQLGIVSVSKNGSSSFSSFPIEKVSLQHKNKVDTRTREFNQFISSAVRVKMSPDQGNIAIASGNSIRTFNSLSYSAQDFLEEICDPSTESGYYECEKTRANIIYDFVFYEDSTSIIYVSKNGQVGLWEFKQSQPKHTIIQNYGQELYSIDIDNKRQIAVIGSKDGSIYLLDLRNKQTLEKFKGHSWQVNSVKFSPQKDILASASLTGEVKLWDLNESKKEGSKFSEIKSLIAHTGSVISLDFNPDGTMLASASDDRTIQLWNVEYGELLKTLQGHQSAINSVKFDDSGKYLASGSADGTIKLWEIEDVDQLLNRACARLKLYLEYSPDVSSQDRKLCKP
jgi:WD40 repeat protein